MLAGRINVSWSRDECEPRHQVSSSLWFPVTETGQFLKRVVLLFKFIGRRCYASLANALEYLHQKNKHTIESKISTPFTAFPAQIKPHAPSLTQNAAEQHAPASCPRIAWPPQPTHSTPPHSELSRRAGRSAQSPNPPIPHKLCSASPASST